jgi:hypothetical protein
MGGSITTEDEKEYILIICGRYSDNRQIFQKGNT